MSFVRVKMGPNSRTVRQWSAAGKAGWKTNASNYARKHGAAMVIRASGSGTLFYMDKGKLRSKTFPKIAPYN